MGRTNSTPQLKRQVDKNLPKKQKGANGTDHLNRK